MQVLIDFLKEQWNGFLGHLRENKCFFKFYHRGWYISLVRLM